jgi:hypothetical protein
MSTNRNFDRIAEAWLAEGPSELADRVLDAALDEVHLTSQRRRMAVPWRTPQMPMPLGRGWDRGHRGPRLAGFNLNGQRPRRSGGPSLPPSTPTPWTPSGRSETPAVVDLASHLFTCIRHAISSRADGCRSLEDAGGLSTATGSAKRASVVDRPLRRSSGPRPRRPGVRLATSREKPCRCGLGADPRPAIQVGRLLGRRRPSSCARRCEAYIRAEDRGRWSISAVARGRRLGRPDLLRGSAVRPATTGTSSRPS